MSDVPRRHFGQNFVPVRQKKSPTNRTPRTVSWAVDCPMLRSVSFSWRLQWQTAANMTFGERQYRINAHADHVVVGVKRANMALPWQRPHAGHVTLRGRGIIMIQAAQRYIVSGVDLYRYSAHLLGLSVKITHSLFGIWTKEHAFHAYSQFRRDILRWCLPLCGEGGIFDHAAL